MVDAVDRAVKVVVGEEASALSRVTVYALGDGKRPLSAAAICLYMPSSWTYVSIDPLLEVDTIHLGEYSDRFILYGGMSQDYSLSVSGDSATQGHYDDADVIPPPLAIVIALHSHAPLSEFWARLSGHKIAITMECCAEYSELHSVGEVPVMEFEDFEVYSPKRKVKIYSSFNTSLDNNIDISINSSSCSTSVSTLLMNASSIQARLTTKRENSMSVAENLGNSDLKLSKII
jgi:hypothetical protein